MKRLTAIAALAAALSPGNLDRLRTVLSEVVPEPLPDEVAYELLLQSHLFFGFPQALEAAKVFAGVVRRTAVPDTLNSEKNMSDEEIRRRGRYLCERIYRPNLDRLVSNVQRVSPELAEWMIVDGYGKVLSRPGPEALEREIASIVFLAISDHPVQLYSHVRGARNLGGTPDLIRSAIGTGILSREQMDTVENTIEQVFRK